MGTTIISANGLRCEIKHDVDKFSWEDSWVGRWLRAIQTMDELSNIHSISADKPASKNKLSYDLSYVDERTHSESYSLDTDEPYNFKKAKRHGNSSDGFTDMEYECCEECCLAFQEMCNQLKLTKLVVSRV